MHNLKTDVLILGAGLSGLLAADMLVRKGRSSVVLEKEAHLGGLATTFRHNGFGFDVGGHRLCLKHNPNKEYIKSLCRDEGLMRIRQKSKILFGGKYVDYPVTLSSLLRLHKKYIPRILADILRLKKSKPSINFKEWVLSNYGQTLYDIYFKEYTRKVWGLSPDELSGLWADKRIGSTSCFKLLKSILLSDGDTTEYEKEFYYPQRGIQSVIDSLATRASGKSSVYRQAAIKQVIDKDRRLQSVIFESGGEQFSVSFNQMLSTVPLKELFTFLPSVPDAIREQASKSVRYRNLILACFIINREMITRWHWCYVPNPSVLYSRIYEPKFWSLKLAQPQRSLLCLEIFCSDHDSLWTKSDAAISDNALAALKKSGLLNESDRVTDTCVRKIAYAYPLHYLGFESPLNTLQSFLKSFPNLYCAGRNGTHAYFDMEECIEDVKTAVSSNFS